MNASAVRSDAFGTAVYAVVEVAPRTDGWGPERMQEEDSLTPKMPDRGSTQHLVAGVTKEMEMKGKRSGQVPRACKSVSESGMMGPGAKTFDPGHTWKPF
ncbi:uncharacterized protein E0L32_001333 [Thyridium curvatum]|uniref:Uncharacterized protein n=1 Tax=Thyridium curvatum TaxID=1093900 RepID=A0A507ATW0_9PEZI|nr:uncharacterized protein E0L32_001333 [Thyridium curvatum]TPX10136.1 hypothetical protein E0L32_001333 [Thyridium curvatum]